MYGLAAIEQANGWAMAGAGACIVLIGLAVLSFLISMIPRITAPFEKKKSSLVAVKEPSSKPIQQPVRTEFPDDVEEASALFIEQTKDLGDDFTLIDLHKKSKQLGVVDPHLTIRRFREAGFLVSLGDGRFAWQPISK
jgi:hypothetical protein